MALLILGISRDAFQFRKRPAEDEEDSERASPGPYSVQPSLVLMAAGPPGGLR